MCQRDLLYQRIIRNTLNNRKSLLVGPRGIGKTQFLLNLQTKLRKLSNSIPIYIKIYDQLNYNLNWLKRILNAISDELYKRGYDISKGLTGYLLEKAYKTKNINYLELLKDQIKSDYGLRVIFLIDDIDLISSESISLLDFADILTTSRTFDTKALDKFEVIKITPFSIEDYECLPTAFKRIMDPYTWGEIIAQFSGLPVYFSQVLSIIKTLNIVGSPIDRSLIKMLKNDRDFTSNLYRIAENFYTYYMNTYGDKIKELMSIANSKLKSASIIDLIETRFKDLLELGLISVKKEEEITLHIVDKILYDWFRSKFQVSLLLLRPKYHFQ